MLHIHDTIKSAMAQNYVKFEHIFVVSKSNDGTENYLKNLKYNQKKVFFFDKGNLYDCLNYGIKKSNGDIIFILHSDDMLSNKNIFSKIARLLNSNLDFIYSNIKICKKYDTSKIIRKWESSKIVNNFWLASNLPAHTSLFIKKKSLKKIGYYNNCYKISSDYDFLIRLFQSKMKYRFDKNYNIIMRNGGLSSQLRHVPTKIYEDLTILKKFFKDTYLLIYLFKILKKAKQLI